MEENKSKTRSLIIFLIIALVASVALNVYTLYKLEYKDDIYANCSLCGSDVYIYYSHQDREYKKECQTCIRAKAFRDFREEDNSDNNSDDSADSVSFAYVTRTGSKYHHIWCRYVNDKNDLSYYESSYEAESAGYSACSVCW